MGGGRERRRPEATPRRRESSGVDAGTETRETPPAIPPPRPPHVAGNTPERRLAPKRDSSPVPPPQVYVIGGKEFSTEQVVGLVFGFYCVLGFLGTRGGSKKEAPKAAESAPAASGSVVSMLDDGFEAWAASPANMKKWEDSIAEMK